MPTHIGLDIGRQHIRAVEVDKSKKGVVVVNSGFSDDFGWELDEKIDIKKVSKRVSDFISDNKFSTSRTILAIKEKDVFMTIVQLPKMSDKELKTSIMYEAEQYVPLSLEEVKLDFQKLDLGNFSNSSINVQLVAAKKDVLSRYIEILKGAKLVPLGLEPEALSLGRAFSTEEVGDYANVILHIGIDRTLIIVTFKNFVMFTRTLTLGGNSFTRSISQALGLDYMQAEEYKKTYGLDKSQVEGKIHGVLDLVLSKILSELRRSLVFFTSKYPDVTINRVILSGGSALMPGLLLYVAGHINLEVELANPFKNVSFSKGMKDRENWHIEHGPIFGVAVGLALKEV